MAVLENLEPQKVFHFFEELCKIPHETFDIKRISDYCKAFAEERNLEVVQDKVDNIIIRKGGTSGYEDSEPVILQGHLDMVCEKVPGSAHDFKTDPLDLFVEDGLVGARGTSLGADNGIAVAMIMALLDSDDIPHPPIEAIFTADEETGMGGATNIDLSVLKGKKLINMDAEVEGILTTGCAGGIAFVAELPVGREERKGDLVTFEIRNLLGGHSGMEIHKQRGNAHKLMGRLLKRVSEITEFYLVSIEGGAKDNVIAMEDTAKILVPEGDGGKAAEIAAEMKAVWDNELMGDEPNYAVSANVSAGVTENACDRAGTDRVLSYLLVVPNGVQGFSRKLENLVETSLNIGYVQTEETLVRAAHMIRSSVESQKQMVRIQVEELAKVLGAETKIISEYPAWQYDPDSQLRKVMEDIYTDMYGKAPVVFAIHAGLECGMFLGKRPDLDCVSIGPNIRDVHSFDERLDIASTERTWNYLKNILSALK